MSQLGNAINERRLSLHYSIGQLATVVGVTASEVRSWENGERVPDGAEIGKLASALKMKRAELEKLAPAEAPQPKASESIPDATAVVAATPKARPASRAKAPAADDEAEEASEPHVEVVVETPPSSRRSKVAPPEPAESALEGEPDDTPDAELVAESDDVDQPTPEIAEPPAEEVEASSITDLPTERIPIIKDAPPPPERQQAPAPVAVATAPPPRPTPAAGVPTPATPWRQTMEMIFDRDRPWLFWIRTTLLVISMLILLRILAWALPEFFGTLGDILDTIQSTTPDPELQDPIPISP